VQSSSQLRLRYLSLLNVAASVTAVETTQTTAGDSPAMQATLIDRLVPRRSKQPESSRLLMSIPTPQLQQPRSSSAESVTESDTDHSDSEAESSMMQQPQFQLSDLDLDDTD